MPKRPLTAVEAFDLRQSLHVATLDALMVSRRWEPGDLVFQGGTSLHLAHGSPRFSEDLDFLVNSTLKLDTIAKSVERRLEGTSWLPADTNLTISKSKDDRNPHVFVVSIKGPDLIGSVRVKVELWKTDEATLAAVKATVSPVRLARGPAAGMQAFIPTAELREIYVDKVFALAARPYLKPRDVFDLHWIVNNGGPYECTVGDLEVRLATYPNETPENWLEKAAARLVELRGAEETVSADLRKWLPSSWPLSSVGVSAMIRTASEALEKGIETMEVIVARRRVNAVDPSP